MLRSKPQLKHILILLPIFFGIKSLLHAQSNYSTENDYLIKRTNNTAFYSPFKSAYPDTTIVDAHNYFQRSYLGNMGLPSPVYQLELNEAHLGFILHNFSDQNNKIQEKDVEYYKTKGPYASLEGIAGSKQLQMFRLLFTNSFKDNFNVTLRLNRNTSTGYYVKQQSFINNFYSSTNFQTKNNRYGFNNFILINNNRFQENGGIATDTLGDVNLLVSKNLVPVKLSNASHDNRELTGMWENWLRLNRNSDSNMHAFISTESSYSTKKYKYKDLGISTDQFYLLQYLDTAQTIDSTRLRQINNAVKFSLVNKSHTIGFYAGFKNEISNIWQKADTSFMNNIVISGLDIQRSLNSDSLNKWQLISNSTFNYIANGSYEGNYSISSHNRIENHRNGRRMFFISANVYADNRNPNYIYNRWYSNHFIWSNQFKNTQTTGAELKLGYRFIELIGNYKSYKNYLYFDDQGYPQQNTGNITAMSGAVQMDHVFFKHLGIGGKQQFQQVSSHVISLPKSVSIGKLYYYGNLFKNNLNLAIGAQVEYYDEFLPYGYMPATQVFYVQEKYKAGNFTFVDVFLNARIKPVSFFVKMENVLHGLIGSNYSMVPGYYQPERAIRFGLKWQFFD